MSNPSIIGTWGVERLLNVYGGRAIDVLQLASDEPPLHKAIDADDSVLAAEIVFAIREELARTLVDIVHRRLMLGFRADQGRPLYEMLAAIAADEFNWSDSERHDELRSLHAYSDSFEAA